MTGWGGPPVIEPAGQLRMAVSLALLKALGGEQETGLCRQRGCFFPGALSRKRIITIFSILCDPEPHGLKERVLIYGRWTEGKGKERQRERELSWDDGSRALSLSYVHLYVHLERQRVHKEEGNR